MYRELTGCNALHQANVPVPPSLSTPTTPSTSRVGHPPPVNRTLRPYTRDDHRIRDMELQRRDLCQEIPRRRPSLKPAVASLVSLNLHSMQNGHSLLALHLRTSLCLCFVCATTSRPKETGQGSGMSYHHPSGLVSGLIAGTASHASSAFALIPRAGCDFSQEPEKTARRAACPICALRYDHQHDDATLAFNWSKRSQHSLRPAQAAGTSSAAGCKVPGIFICLGAWCIQVVVVGNLFAQPHGAADKRGEPGANLHPHVKAPAFSPSLTVHRVIATGWGHIPPEKRHDSPATDSNGNAPRSPGGLDVYEGYEPRSWRQGPAPSCLCLEQDSPYLYLASYGGPRGRLA